MRPGRGNLAAGPESFDRGASVRVGVDAAHVIVGGRRNRDRLAPRVEPGSLAGREHRRKARRELGPDLAAIEKGAAPAHHLAVDAAGDNVARPKLGVGMQCAHEALAAAVDQQRAFAAQRLGGERRGVAADIDRGRMKLHELCIGDGGAGAGGDGDAFAAGFAWGWW